MTPKSLAEVAEMALRGEPFRFCFANFLDEFYRDPTEGALSESPALLNERVEHGKVRDAYLAATAEELARKHGLRQPEWIYAESRKLRLPWFASDLQALRAVLILESPTGFRSRNLFVSENALARA